MDEVWIQCSSGRSRSASIPTVVFVSQLVDQAK